MRLCSTAVFGSELGAWRASGAAEARMARFFVGVRGEMRDLALAEAAGEEIAAGWRRWGRAGAGVSRGMFWFDMDCG